MAPAEQNKKLVKKAVKMQKPLEQMDVLPELSVRETNDGEKLTFSSHWATHLTKEDNEWIFDLFRANMYDMYRMSQWGWDEESKRGELTATTARFIIVKNSKDEKIGYLHYRFDVDFDRPVLYIYEIQVRSDYQQKGIGSLLLFTVERLAEKMSMERLMATVFAFNEKSLAFFHKQGFDMDTTCPDEKQMRDYFILSKALVY